MKHMRIRRFFVVLLVGLLGLVMTAGPAAAHHKDGHAGGKDKEATSEVEGDDSEEESKPPKDKDKDKDKDEGDQPFTSGAPGNNGTIKIDGEPYDTTKGNESHVGCNFRVLYWGTDEGEDLTSTLTFEAQSPTDGAMVFTDTITLGPDEPDVAGPFNLASEFEAAGIEPHPQQGWHVKLTTNTEYSQGADTKHKVFWIQCDEEEQTLAEGLFEDTEVAAGSDQNSGRGLRLNRPGSGANSGDVADEVLGGSIAANRDSVLGSSEEAETAGGVLPFTGQAILDYLLIAGALIAAGSLLLRIRRRRA
jgi:hypothetical protein